MSARPTAVLAGLVALVIAAGFLLDNTLATPPPIVVTAGEGQAAIAGAWYCTVGDTGDGRALSVIAAAPIAGFASQVRLDSFSDGAATRGPELELVTGTHAVREFAPGLVDVGTSARWFEAPAAVTRTWTVNTPGAPSGFVEGPCETEASPTWSVPGFSTAGGAQAWLVVGNPFDTDASVALSFLSPDGRIDRQLLQNVVIPKRSTRTIPLNEHVPEEVDLSAEVTTRSGRVIVEGYQTFDAALGGIDGVTILKAAAEPATSWTVPWFRIGGEHQAWVWVANPGDRPASISITLHTTEGGALPEALEEIDIPPGRLQRIDLRGLLPEDTPRAGITVTSDNQVPVLVSVASQLRDNAQRTGAAIQIGATSPDTSWVLSGGAMAGRRTFLHLANPDPETAVVDVRIWTDSGPIDAPELRGITVPAGGINAVNVGQFMANATSFTLFVTATQGRVVAGRESFDIVGTYQLVAGIGVPGGTWAGGRAVPPVRFDPSLLERLGDRSGDEPGIVPTPEPLPTPSDSTAPDDTPDDTPEGGTGD